MQIEQYIYPSRGLRSRAVGGDLHKVYLHGALYLFHQIAHKDHRALENAEQEQLFAAVAVVAVDLRRDRCGYRVDLLLGNELVCNVVYHFVSSSGYP